MKEDIETIIVEFDNVAAKIYSTLFKQFSTATRKIDRNKEENVYKMQAAKFINTLKYQLGEQVEKTLAVSDSKIHAQLETALSVKVNYYLQEFQLKCNML